MMKKRIDMSYQDPLERISNFKEVALGYNFEEALFEANRCLECKHAPCIKGCPVGINIPGFIRQIKENDIEKAFSILTNQNSFPGICGRVCPQENQCEAVCVRGIKGEPVAIGRLERFTADNVSAKEIQPVSVKYEKVAIVGSGPAGLACGGVLANLGYEVHLYEALHVAGGVLTYGIPEFRLPKSIVKKEIENLKKLGVKIHLNTIIGKTKLIDELFEEGFKSIFIGSGAGLPKFMNIPGENLNGVYSANEFLTRVNLMKAYDSTYDTPIRKMKKVVVVGGGNVAMDAARCAKRLNVEEVYIVYRRSEKEMPARLEEIHHAKEEGIKFVLLTNPVEIHADERKNVKSVECIKMELVESTEGRARPVEIEGSNYEIEADTVIMALGNHPNPLISSTTADLEVNKWGCFVVDETLMTSKENVYAGGDAVTGAATVILAMGAGKKAAYEIDKKLRGK
ncbi:MAG: NADPH-dependent glutamate synthase [Bacilli bacterium]|nr:NADPH-dependent glutamate synthase [Bacilli bacterium]